MSTPGKSLLKTGSILLIIYGVISTAVSVLGLISFFAGLNDPAIEGSILVELADIIIITMILVLIIGLLALVLGCVGLKKCTDPAKGGFFIAAGIVLCAISLISLVLSIAYGSFNITSLGVPAGMLAIIGTALPVLYIIGGCIYKKAFTPAA